MDIAEREESAFGERKENSRTLPPVQMFPSYDSLHNLSIGDRDIIHAGVDFRIHEQQISQI
jgi:hypothetical protein